ncbi:MAG TPA: DUF2059 domain-containing protein [Candidatus Solibacter sp.]|nr:DUF2059 domain-containing protein [Candidatus Solibacter sp.]
MKICAAVLCLFFLSVVSIQAQSHSQAPSGQQTSQQQAAPAGQLKIDSAKEADIRRLLDLTGVKALVAQTMDGMQQSIKPMLANSLPPGEYRAKLIDLFFEKFRSKAGTQHLLDMVVPTYDKYFSHEEIKGLLKFYETPLGQKAISVLPQMMGEMQEEGRKWGENLGRESMIEVLAEHPDLRQALEAAQKGAQPQ